MIKISQAIEQIFNEDEQAYAALQRGVLNLSAYARKIKKQVEELTFKEVDEKTIVVSLSRYNKQIKKQESKQDRIEILNISIHSNLMELTYEKTQTNVDKIKRILNSFSGKQKGYLTYTQGISEITIVAEARIIILIKKQFKARRAVFEKKGLTAITLRFPEKYIHIPNLLYRLSQRLAYKKINIIELISTFSEVTYIVEKQDTEIAVSQLSKEIGGAEI
ncbi:MAG: hypothetical protein GF332_03290 [Candidatus Moranbacteria bacterium]|nr:hypothetical protein [Candidatus Moranbacteria bacterium]